MKLGNWIAVVGAMGMGAALAAGAQGCTVTAGNPSDGGIDFGDDGGFHPNDSGSTTGGDDSGDTTHQDGSSAANPCNECLFGACEGQWALCMGDAACQAIYSCAVAPACIVDQNCIDACYNNSSSASAQAAYKALADCDVLAECTTCGSICGTSGDPSCSVDAGPQGDAATAQDCSSCTATNCSTERSACATGSDCDAYTQCLANCADTACLDKCGSDHAQGKTDATALGTCTQTSCASACGL